MTKRINKRRDEIRRDTKSYIGESRRNPWQPNTPIKIEWFTLDLFFENGARPTVVLATNSLTRLVRGIGVDTDPQEALAKCLLDAGFDVLWAPVRAAANHGKPAIPQTPEFVAPFTVKISRIPRMHKRSA